MSAVHCLHPAKLCCLDCPADSSLMERHCCICGNERACCWFRAQHDQRHTLCRCQTRCMSWHSMLQHTGQCKPLPHPHSLTTMRTSAAKIFLLGRLTSRAIKCSSSAASHVVCLTLDNAVAFAIEAAAVGQVSTSRHHQCQAALLPAPRKQLLRAYLGDLYVSAWSCTVSS